MQWSAFIIMDGSNTKFIKSMSVILLSSEFVLNFSVPIKVTVGQILR
jgi:hypothetical protein